MEVQEGTAGAQAQHAQGSLRRQERRPAVQARGTSVPPHTQLWPLGVTETWQNRQQEACQVRIRLHGRAEQEAPCAYAPEAPLRKHQKCRGGADGGRQHKTADVQWCGSRREGSSCGRGVQDSDDTKEDAGVAAEDTHGDQVRAATIQRAHTV